MKTSDYFAEMYVAGRFAEAGWNIYFPRRDNGFDFIICKQNTGENPIIRPVQVKGKYPENSKVDKPVYGFSNKLTQLHPEMVLAIPFFDSAEREMPLLTAYMPRSLIRPSTKGRVRSVPAIFKDGKPRPRRDYVRFFGDDGIKLLEKPGWSEFGLEASEC